MTLAFDSLWNNSAGSNKLKVIITTKMCRTLITRHNIYEICQSVNALPYSGGSRGSTRYINVLKLCCILLDAREKNVDRPNYSIFKLLVK